MENCCHRQDCEACPAEFLCHCLRVTKEVVAEAVTRLGLQTLHEVRNHTGAGEGCTACHRRIRQAIQEVVQSSPSSSPPICSVR
jgi:NifU-like protein